MLTFALHLIHYLLHSGPASVAVTGSDGIPLNLTVHQEITSGHSGQYGNFGTAFFSNHEGVTGRKSHSIPLVRLVKCQYWCGDITNLLLPKRERQERYPAF